MGALRHDRCRMLDEADGVEYEVLLKRDLERLRETRFVRVATRELSPGNGSLPDNWMLDSTSPSEGPTITVITGGSDPMAHIATGIFGQFIWVDQSEQLVVAIHSAWDKAWRDDHDEHTAKLVSSISNREQENTQP